MQGQRLHLSIYHPDWLAKSTSALPHPPPPTPHIPLPLCHSLTLDCTPTPSKPPPPLPPPPAWDPGLTLPPARPSIFAPLAIYLSFSLPSVHPSLPPSQSPLCVSLCFLLHSLHPRPRARVRRCAPGLCRNVLREPVSNTGTRNIWHIFNSQGQLQLFIQRLQLNFPRFLLDLPQIALCVCHIFEKTRPASSRPAAQLSSQIFQRLSSGFQTRLISAYRVPHLLLLLRSFFPSFRFSFFFFPPQLCWVRVPLCNANLITCKLEISPDPSK